MRPIEGDGRDAAPTLAEVTALTGLPLPVDFARIRLYRGGGGAAARGLRALVLFCTRGRAIALGNQVFLPDACRSSLPVLAHEITHCAQYQAWGGLRYYIRAVRDRFRELRHRRGHGPSPYDYTTEATRPFDAYGMEQQGQIVEDWIRGSAHAAALVIPPAGDPPKGQRYSRPDPPPSP